MDEKKKRVWLALLQYLGLIGLAVVSATSYYVFIYKNRFAPAGINGIATMVQDAFGFNVGYLSLIINVPLAILTFFIVNKKYAVRTMVFVVVFSLMNIFYEKVRFNGKPFYQYDAGNNKLLAVIAAGVIGGVIYGYALKLSGSTGGTDYIAILINHKFPHFSIVWVTLVLNSSVAVASFFVYDYNMESVILCLIYSFLLSKFSDMILKGFESAVKIEIITDKPDEIIEELLEKIHHGITEINATGAYTHAEKKMIICIINKRELAEFKKIVSKYANTFAYVSSVNEVYGKFHRKRLF